MSRYWEIDIDTLYEDDDYYCVTESDASGYTWDVVQVSIYRTRWLG